MLSYPGRRPTPGPCGAVMHIAAHVGTDDEGVRPGPRARRRQRIAPSRIQWLCASGEAATDTLIRTYGTTILAGSLGNSERRVERDPADGNPRPAPLPPGRMKGVGPR